MVQEKWRYNANNSPEILFLKRKKYIYYNFKKENNETLRLTLLHMFLYITHTFETAVYEKLRKYCKMEKMS